MRTPNRSADTAKTRAVVPWWLRGRQLSIRFPTPGDPPEPTPAHSPGVIVPPELHAVYADVLGIPALLDSLSTPVTEASERRPTHPENARNGRGGRVYA